MRIFEKYRIRRGKGGEAWNEIICSFILTWFSDLLLGNIGVGVIWLNQSKRFSSVQLLSRVRLFVTPWTTARQASLSITNSQSLLKLMFIELVMPSNHLILCHPFLPLLSILLSIRVFFKSQFFSSGGQSFSFSISPSSEYSALISFRIDWFDILAVQGTLTSLLQHHSFQKHQFTVKTESLLKGTLE